jgi:hypothetical protein
VEDFTCPECKDKINLEPHCLKKYKQVRSPKSIIVIRLIHRYLPWLLDVNTTRKGTPKCSCAIAVHPFILFINTSTITTYQYYFMYFIDNYLLYLLDSSNRYVYIGIIIIILTWNVEQQRCAKINQSLCDEGKSHKKRK